MASLLQKNRLEYQIPLPKALQKIDTLVAQPAESIAAAEEIQKAFPRTSKQPVIRFKKGNGPIPPVKRIGVVFSGGQASGGHNVIAGIFDALKQLNKESRLFGFLNGPAGIIANEYREIQKEEIDSYRNQGGFDLIGSGRTKIETLEQFRAAEKACTDLHLDGLIIIGGDDSNTNAAFMAEYFKEQGCKTAVAGVPKTIDGDLKNEWIEISFGFDTAAKTFSEVIGNIAKDALSAKKYYYFVKVMGRTASHLALECALQTRVNMALIGEELEAENITLKQLVKRIADLIEKRAENGKDYGVIVIPEGIIEFILEFKELIKELNRLLAENTPVDQVSKKLTQASLDCFQSLPEFIKKQLLMDRDPHGNVQVSKIETDKLLIELCKEELKYRQKAGSYSGKFSPQPHFCGYEGRSCLPSNFDSQYCYALGFVALLLVDGGLTGYMAAIQNLSLPVEDWQIAGIPLISLMHSEIRGGKLKPVIRKALVDLSGLPFLEYKEKRDEWALSDDYQCPGPIQFFGPVELTEAITLTLDYESKAEALPAGEDL